MKYILKYNYLIKSIKQIKHMFFKIFENKKLENLLKKDFVKIDYIGTEEDVDFNFGKVEDFF